MYTPSPGTDLILTTDTIIAGVHFLPDDPPSLVARKAIRVNLSDLAAKGARPVGVLQALTLATDTGMLFLEGYAEGLTADLREFDLLLLGGDTTVAPSGGPLAITITAIGEVPSDKALLRSGARVGDLICVSGTLGDAAMGLRALRGQFPPMSAEHTDALVERYRLPRPRLALGQALRGLATACADISDGFCADVGHICEVSHVAAKIMVRMLPISEAVQRRLADNPALLAEILGGGDDYELAFTLPPDRYKDLLAAAERNGTPVTVIGRVVEGNGANHVTVIGDNGQAVAVPSPGYVHR